MKLGKRTIYFFLVPCISGAIMYSQAFFSRIPDVVPSDKNDELHLIKIKECTTFDVLFSFFFFCCLFP